MHIHILGIAGTFMGGVAQLARAKGVTVTGADLNVYPPMSTQLAQAGIAVTAGYDDEFLKLTKRPDCVVIGNALSRGNPAVEATLNENMPYCSGPEWLAREVLHGRHVLAVAGTHGKTTTSSMLTWILEHAGLQPGFLIGGVPKNFGVSARLGQGEYFVVEADEYDSAFFDKRSKFVHYQPKTLVLNNLEYDHADIFDDLQAIMRQFHHLVRTVPSNGKIIVNSIDENLHTVLEMGCWSPRVSVGLQAGDITAEVIQADGSHFEVICHGMRYEVNWSLIGQHNVMNGLAAIGAALQVGVDLKHACEALTLFQGVERRLQVFGQSQGVTVYDDFAHHPTAIATTLEGLRHRVGTEGRVIAVFEPRSNTFKMGVHQDNLAAAFSCADRVYFYQPTGLSWQIADNLKKEEQFNYRVRHSIDELLQALTDDGLKDHDHVVVMSNGSFEQFHQRLLNQLELECENA
ncbi:UDP-N-acetylmuramate:L-alanyl-gamma-D-glutamyl-meso-diaminopimelate ligase [Piscirickettsia salmonis]|uniref:UDP-N-acetylmuramate:L-alanyl-gamma-D-glutamyl- meso-diaminopimelate ligase n=1 Tax=Piscirickettsia salmonis TaxID=1238 RepID=UPI0003091F9C|nr:UDP-N-acetylmuramate:L-alanyl-gamma-D-glutamyl-meso-diaminopimelate ligase [Piscirickettsia salmonis]ALA26005.1 L-alanyl-gamma-D-glutamyl-meso-diaminopimelate ligase [Piscirickettsia salmonis]APS43466.1 UDP-N-acetylmuramate:L-alanyl-gamma-D-glutamyl-meso-diaminopimelate ligase [Piscirickettsia salmonis]APS46818.1 UDP-N-acetylmuramate:L-alanyl-gamma-D-glutamyl-meso-diaminopimelate ligase [Piscirickettsia salmonis]APS50792.1 UDP-N-acetylmuramate:L-alanyl-gamma-D-glutamyl-meso-diaminopimelate l